MGNYNRKDHFYQQAKAEGYRSRAAYKLMELDSKYKLLKSGQRVVDLGCAPGGWVQVVAPCLGENGIVIGIDRLETKAFTQQDFRAGKSIAQVTILTGDITDSAIQQQVIDQAGGKVDLVLSDMSPDLTGVYFQDAARSAELVEIAFDVASRLLVPGGNIVTKIFPGSEADELFNQVRKFYNKVSRVSLKSTRKTSKEFYFVGQGFKGSLD